MFAMAVESPPPSLLRDLDELTSQHVPLFGLVGHTVMYPPASDPACHGILALLKYWEAVD